MLQTALLLLICGLCRHMIFINDSVAAILITLAALGGLFYLGIIIAGTSSYACPFQTPPSIALRGLWKRGGYRIAPVLLPIAITVSNLVRGLSSVTLLLWKEATDSTTSAFLYTKRGVVQTTRSLTLWVRRRTHHPPSLVSLDEVQEDSRASREGGSSLQDNYPWLGGANSSLEETSILPGNTEPWLGPTALASLQKTNANDARCVSWILKNITDPEALDAAVRLAGMIWWFEDGVSTEPPYDLIISGFHECFGSTGEVYSGLRDRAYYSGRAILWIHALAMSKSPEVACRFPLPTTKCVPQAADHDLIHLLDIQRASSVSRRLVYLFNINSALSPMHIQWISNLLLHFSWANQTTPGSLDRGHLLIYKDQWTTVPLNVMLNRLLAWCNLLGSPVGEEVFKVQEKSYASFRLLFFESSTYTLVHQ